VAVSVIAANPEDLALSDHLVQAIPDRSRSSWKDSGIFQI
jgi:hypothetical protein